MPSPMTRATLVSIFAVVAGCAAPPAPAAAPAPSEHHHELHLPTPTPRVTVAFEGKEVDVVLADVPHDGPAASLGRVWSAAFPAADLAALHFDLVGSDGFHPSSRPACARPLTGREVGAARIEVATHDVSFDESSTLPGCYRVKGVVRIEGTREPTTWIATWHASPQQADPDDGLLRVEGATLRLVVHPSQGGPAVRVHLSNLYGDAPIPIGDAHIGSVVDAKSLSIERDAPLTFGGKRAFEIPTGQEVLSDPIAWSVEGGHDVAISLFLPRSATLSTTHAFALQSGVLSPPGNFAGAGSIGRAKGIESWFLLSGVDVAAPAAAGAVVAFGDSITDGFASTPDTNRRWPDVLAARLRASFGPRAPSVVNAGIAGNCVLKELVGDSALDRFDRDALGVPGVKAVILTEGLNDIGTSGQPKETSASDVIAGLQSLVRRARAAGLRVYGGTLPPYGGATSPLRYTPEGEAKRAAVNRWIRESGTFDGVFDFDRALRDPSDASRLRPDLASEDHIHPNDRGYAAMAEAIDVSVLGPNEKE